MGLDLVYNIHHMVVVKKVVDLQEDMLSWYMVEQLDGHQNISPLLYF